jgi:hypothetical protein
MPKSGSRLDDHDNVRKALVAILCHRCPNLSDPKRYVNFRERNGRLNDYAQLIINVRENSTNMFNVSQDLDNLLDAKIALNTALTALAQLSVGSERKINRLVPVLDDEDPRYDVDVAYGPFIAWDDPEALSLRYFEKRKRALQSLHDGVEAFLRTRPTRVSHNRNYDAAAVAQACLMIWKDETGQEKVATSVNPNNNANNPINRLLTETLRALSIGVSAKRALESLKEIGGEAAFLPYLEMD